MTHSRLLAALAFLALPLIAGGVTGCGGAMPAGAAKSVSGDGASSVEDATAAVDHAERALDQLLGPASTALAQGAAPQAAAPPPPPPPPVVAPTAPPAPSASSEARKLDGDDREAPRQPGGATDACATACSALASMERATTHLCELAGDDDSRCASARARVQRASGRVRAACPVCSGS